MKESASRMENIPSTTVIQKHVDGDEAKFSTIAGPLVKNPLENGLKRTEEGPTRQRLNTAGGIMNQCMICGQIYILIVNPEMMGQVIKEENTRRTRMIRNSRKWYHFHTGTEGGSYTATKEH